MDIKRTKAKKGSAHLPDARRAQLDRDGTIPRARRTRPARPKKLYIVKLSDYRQGDYLD